MKKFFNSMNSVAVLVAICVVLSTLIACVNSITAPIIEENLSKAKFEALNKVLPDAQSDFESPASNFEQLRQEGKIPETVTNAHKANNGSGYVIELKTTGGQYAELIIMCGISTDLSIVKIECLQTNATIGEAKTYGERLEGLTKQEVEEMDTVSGATITTGTYKKAILDAINAVINLSGGEADMRTEDEILADNLNAALPLGNGEFSKKIIVGEDHAIDFIYQANNQSGYVYVADKVFVGVDAQGNVVSEGIADEIAALAKEKAAIARGMTVVSTEGYEINENITLVQKNAQGNYVISVNGLGFAYFGDDHVYQPGRNIPIEICVVISPKGTILKCLTVSHQESGGYGAACGEDSYYSQFDGKTAETFKDVEAISGATITTKGYMNAIERALAAVKILEGGATNE